MQTVSWELHTRKLPSTRDSGCIGRAEAQESALPPAPRASKDHTLPIILIYVLLLALGLVMLFCWAGIHKTWVLVLSVVSRILPS